LTCRIDDEELHRRVKSKLAAAGSSFQDLILNAVKDADGASTAIQPLVVEPGQTRNAEEYRLFEAMLYLLREGSEDTRGMVKAVLKPGLGKLKTIKDRKSA
jgi:hypothetical protein